MPRKIPTIFEQIQRNAVALISLFIAFSGLAYNTWRNELTEEQRNIRHAEFRVIETIGEMQEIVDERYYYFPFSKDRSAEASTRLKGFGNVAMSRDLMNLMPPPAPQTGEALHAAWLQHFNQLDELLGQSHSAAAVEAEESLRVALDRSRTAVIGVLKKLN